METTNTNTNIVYSLDNDGRINNTGDGVIQYKSKSRVSQLSSRTEQISSLFSRKTSPLNNPIIVDVDTTTVVDPVQTNLCTLEWAGWTSMIVNLIYIGLNGSQIFHFFELVMLICMNEEKSYELPLTGLLVSGMVIISLSAQIFVSILLLWKMKSVGAGHSCSLKFWIYVTVVSVTSLGLQLIIITIAVLDLNPHTQALNNIIKEYPEKWGPKERNPNIYESYFDIARLVLCSGLTLLSLLVYYLHEAILIRKSNIVQIPNNGVGALVKPENPVTTT